MTPIFKAIMIVLLSLRPYYGDGEKPAERKDRLELVATAIEKSVDYSKCENQPKDKPCEKVFDGDKIDMTAMLIMLGFNESGFARHVHAHKCNTKIGECDSGRARSPWQFQRTPLSRYEWDKYKGADQDSTTLASWAVTKMLARFKKGCGDWQGAISNYATGQTCKWSGAKNRFNHYIKLRKQLADTLKQQTEKAQKSQDDDED